MSHFHDRNQAKQSTNEGKSQWEYTQEFEKAMRQAGIDCPDPIIADGKIHRFKPNRKREKDGWYVFYGYAGAFGDWSRSIKGKWSVDNSSAPKLTPSQREQMQEQAEKARKSQQEETIRKNREAAETALKDWNSFSETGQSDYLIRKTVDAIGIRFGKGFIAIPLFDVEGKLWSYQTIRPDGAKRFLSGGRKKGCFHTLGQLEDGSPIYVTEGYSTGASVYMATNISTVVAFDSGNFDPVITSMKEQYPHSLITIAADNDCWKNEEENVGRIKACSARTKHGCSLVLPSFQNTESKPTDFNDLHVLEGLEAVRQQMGSIDSCLNEMPEGFPELRPLYNLHDLTQRPEAPVLIIVEGEKPAEAAKGLFPDYVVTTSAQGSQSQHKTDCSPLKGRNVIICPNFDSTSIQYGNTVVQLCRNVEVNSLHYLPVQDLVRKLLEKSEIAEGYDLADAVVDGLTVEVLKQHSLSDFLIPISENETISDLIKSRLQRFFDNRLFPVFKKTKLFKKNVKEASTQGKKVQEEKAEIDAQIATIDTEIQEQESCLKEKVEELPSLKLRTTQQKEISLKQSGDAESKAAFKQADEERKNCQNFIKSLEEVLGVRRREKEELQSKAAVLMQQIDDAANIETQLQSEALAVFKTCLSSEEVSAIDHSSPETKALFSFFENEKIKCEKLFSEARYLLQDEALLIVRQVNEDTSSAHDAYDINGLPKGFRLNEDGSVEYYWESKEDCGWSWLCSYLVPTHRMRDKNNKGWSKVFTAIDRDRVQKDIILTPAMLSWDIKLLTETLTSCGVEYCNGGKIKEFITRCNPKKRLRSVNKIGWYNQESYVLPHKTYSAHNLEEVRLFCEGNLPEFKQQGTLQEWQEHIGKYAEGNSRIQIGILQALSSTMLTPLGRENFGIHLVGITSKGKSTTLGIACSVFASEFRSWRTTDNAAESWGLFSNDNLLALDEMSQASPETVAEMTYMLGNGQGKGRSNRKGVARDVAKFKICFLSTGEAGVAAKLREGKGRSSYHGGQAIRLMEIPADAQGYGIFENIHSLEDGAALSRHFTDSSKKYCGALGDAWLTYLTENLQEVKKLILQYEQEFIKICPLEQGADGQVKRVRYHFMLMAGVGETAIKIGILNWPQGEAIRVCLAIFQDWINSRGGIESHDNLQAERRLIDFMEKHGSERFEHVESSVEKEMWKEVSARKNENTREVRERVPTLKNISVRNRVGYRMWASIIDEGAAIEAMKDEQDLSSHIVWDYYWHPEQFKQEILRTDSKAAQASILKYLIGKDLLIPDPKGKSSISIRISGKQMRLYKIGEWEQ